MTLRARIAYVHVVLSNTVAYDLTRVPTALRPYVQGVRIVDSPQTGNAEASTRLGVIHLYPKFYGLDADIQDFVFAHELGHVHYSKISTELATAFTDHGIDPWDTDSLPYGQHNQEEAFADAFATYFLNPTELRQRYPAWYGLVAALV